MDLYEVTPSGVGIIYAGLGTLGHINNASYATWFEEARRFIFRFFVPDLDPTTLENAAQLPIIFFGNKNDELL